MHKAIQIFRGLLNVRSCNRVIASKYCVSRKDGKISGEKDDTSTGNWQKSVAEKNKISENEVLASKETVQSANFRSVNEKVELVKNKPESDVSSAKDSTSANEKLQEEKLARLIHSSKVDVDSKTSSSLRSELQSYKKNFESEHKDVGKSEFKVSDTNDSFASLLRRSAFVDLGDPVGKLVVGKIYHTVDNDLYIDFGWKFPTVCPRPKVNPEIYNIGAKVLLKIKDLELTARFLGEKEYTSLLEADCDLIHRINEDGSKFVKPVSEKTTPNVTLIG